MPKEYMRAFASADIPRTHRAVGRGGEQGVAHQSQRPHPTGMAIKSFAQSTSLDVKDIDGAIIASSDDLVRVEKHSSDDVTIVSSKGQVPGVADRTERHGRRAY